MKTDKAHLKQALELLFYTIDFEFDDKFNELPADIQTAYRLAHTALSHDEAWDQSVADELFIKLFGNNELPPKGYWET